MKRLILFLLTALQAVAQPVKPVWQSADNVSLPRFTTDPLNRPVLSWVEKVQEVPVLCYAVSTDEGRTFGPAVRVPTPAGTATHSEGRPKVTFRGDGVVYATFEVRRPTEEAPRAGDVLYRTSADGGHTWSDLRPLHANVQPGGSHSFHDLMRLPGGELGAVWLDEKLPGREGRTVKFARTGADGLFGPEVLVDSSACQCCRTSLAADARGRLFLAYRDLLADGSRDMSVSFSSDGGHRFSPPQLVHADGWKVQACPHSGPQLVTNGEEVWATWFSGAVTRPGIRLKSLQNTELRFDPANAAMRFPQAAALENGELAVCWEEWVGEGADAYRKIGLKAGSAPIRYLTPPGVIATQPTLLATPQSLLLAYTVLEGNGSRIEVVCVGYSFK